MTSPTRLLLAAALGWLVLAVAVVALSSGDETHGWLTFIVGFTLLVLLGPLAWVLSAWSRNPTPGLRRFGRVVSILCALLGLLWTLNVVDSGGWQAEHLNAVVGGAILLGAAVLAWRTLKLPDQSS